MKHLVVLGLLGILVSSCKRKYDATCDGTNSTYNSNMKSIIDANCVSCHSSYTSYANIKSILTSGSFKQHVLTDQDMPQGSKLSHSELDKIKCWSDAGFPEK